MHFGLLQKYSRPFAPKRLVKNVVILVEKLMSDLVRSKLNGMGVSLRVYVLRLRSNDDAGRQTPSLYCLMRNQDKMTLRKTHPTLTHFKIVWVVQKLIDVKKLLYQLLLKHIFVITNLNVPMDV